MVELDRSALFEQLDDLLGRLDVDVLFGETECLVLLHLLVVELVVLLLSRIVVSPLLPREHDLPVILLLLVLLELLKVHLLLLLFFGNPGHVGPEILELLLIVVVRVGVGQEIDHEVSAGPGIEVEILISHLSLDF